MLSGDNNQVTFMDLTPPPNDYGYFNETYGYTFDDENYGALVCKTDLESVPDEIGFVAATEMGGFTRLFCLGLQRIVQR